MPARQVQSSTTLEDRILAAATELFIRHGYRGVSFLTIAATLGISHSHIHYYFRTKTRLAEAVLDAYASRTTADFRAIWTGDGSDLQTRLVRSRDWIWRQYIWFNPTGSGARNWGLLSSFTSDAELLSPAMRRTIRQTLEVMDAYIETGLMQAIRRGELSAEIPRHALVLQISSLLHTSRQIIRFEGRFQRLDDLLRWTYYVIVTNYGFGRAPSPWPKLPALRAGRRAKGA